MRWRSPWRIAEVNGGIDGSQATLLWHSWFRTLSIVNKIIEVIITHDFGWWRRQNTLGDVASSSAIQMDVVSNNGDTR